MRWRQKERSLARHTSSLPVNKSRTPPPHTQVRVDKAFCDDLLLALFKYYCKMSQHPEFLGIAKLTTLGMDNFY